MQYVRFVPTLKQVKGLQHFLHGTKNRLEHARALAVLTRRGGMTVKYDGKEGRHMRCMHAWMRYSDGVEGTERMAWTC